jgi:hypothetical protein
MLDRIHIGWHWLERTLNGIIAAVNAQKPLPSATIAIEESPNGMLLKVVQAQNQPPSTGPAQQQVVWHDVAWAKVTVVDPTTCAQSSISVLIQSPGNNITIQ